MNLCQSVNTINIALIYKTALYCIHNGLLVVFINTGLNNLTSAPIIIKIQMEHSKNLKLKMYINYECYHQGKQ